MEANGITVEAVPYWRPDLTRQVTAALDIDVTGGEQDCDSGTGSRWPRRMSST